MLRRQQDPFHYYSGFEDLDWLINWSTHIDHATLACLEVHTQREPREDVHDGIMDPEVVLKPADVIDELEKFSILEEKLLGTPLPFSQKQPSKLLPAIECPLSRCLTHGQI
jgi:hypothetical protein